MKERVIQPSEWNSFLDTFSQQHEGWLVTVEEIPSGGGGPRVEARALPLRGLFSNPQPEHHLTHTVSQPVRIVLVQSDAGADEGLTIERQSGRSTRIKFRDALRPEEADGLAKNRAGGRRPR